MSWKKGATGQGRAFRRIAEVGETFGWLPEGAERGGGFARPEKEKGVRDEQSRGGVKATEAWERLHPVGGRRCRWKIENSIRVVRELADEGKGGGVVFGIEEKRPLEAAKRSSRVD